MVDVGDGYIRIYDQGVELVGWVEDEWIEDPSVVYSIANAIKLAFTDVGELRERLAVKPEQHYLHKGEG